MPERDDWQEVMLALLGSWPGRLDEMTATAFVRELMARGIEPGEALRALRASEAEHPPSAGVILAEVRRIRRRIEIASERPRRFADSPLRAVEPGP